MALIIYNTSTCGILTGPARHRGLPPLPSSHQANLLSFPSAPPLRPQRHSPRQSTHVARARKGLSSRTRRLEERSKKGAATTTTTEDEESAGMAVVEDGEEDVPLEGYAWPPPQLPGEQTDFWEGPQWNAFGFVVQYLWAFGIVFALIACGIAVATYNEGATDFKQTPIYKESMQSRELLEEPDASNADVFEGNPTEEAPSLE